MVLRKDRPPFGASEGAMNNEQPVSKRQRIDGLAINGNRTAETPSTTINTAATAATVAQPPSTSSACNDVVDHHHGVRLLHPDNEFFLPTVDAVHEDNRFGKRAPTMRPHKTEEANSNDVWQPLNAGLLKQCLCAVSRTDLQRPFQTQNARLLPTQQHHHNHHHHHHNHLHQPLVDWPPVKLVPFLSQLQLLCDIYLKQRRCGRTCRAICRALDTAERTALINEIIELADYADRFVQYLAVRVLCTFLVVAQNDYARDEWLKRLMANVFETSGGGTVSTRRVGFSLEIFRRILEWNDVDLHPLDEEGEGYMDGDELSGEESDGDVLGGGGGGNVGTRGVVPTLPPIENNYFNFYTDYGNTEHTVSTVSAAAAAASASGSATFAIPNAVLAATITTSSTSSVSAAQSNTSSRLRISPTMSSSVSVTSSSASSRHTSDVDEIVNYGDDDDVEEEEEDDEDDDDDDDDDDDVDDDHRSDTVEGCRYKKDDSGFRSKNLKFMTVQYMGNKWPALLAKIKAIMDTLVEQNSSSNNISGNTSAASTTTAAATTITTHQRHRQPNPNENLTYTFLELWRAIIAGSAKISFLTVNDTHPFYVDLDVFEQNHLHRLLPPVIYKQVLQLFNAVLCYGDSLATEMSISDETCKLARRIISHMRVGGLLQTMPVTDVDNPVSLIGYAGRSACDTMIADAKKRKALGSSSTDTSKNDSRCLTASVAGYEQTLPNYGASERDKTFLQQMVLLVLKSVAVSVRGMRSDSSDSSIDSIDSASACTEYRIIAQEFIPMLDQLNQFCKGQLQLHPELHFSRTLVTLFIDQDDFLIEAMVCTLDVAAGFHVSSAAEEPAFTELIWLINPVYTFLEFLEQTNRNWELLLNYLISTETCFLLYFLRFLKYVTTHWAQFEFDCREFGSSYGQRDVCQYTMSLLGELRREIFDLVTDERFPYDIWPVLKLMDKLTALWECPL